MRIERMRLFAATFLIVTLPFVAVMLLTASVGTTVRLETDGPDEVAAMREIAALFHDGFGERS